MEEITSKKEIPIGTVIGITILAAIIFGASAYLYANNKATKEIKSLNAQITDLRDKISNMETATKPNDETAGWKTYTNTKYNYSFKYPDTATMTASADNSDDLAINPMADGVNVFPVGNGIGNGIFYVSSLNIEFTATDIKNYFNPTNPENVTLTTTTIAETSSYKIAILGDSAVVSTFYFIKSPKGAVLELTVVNNSKDAQNILSSFQFTKNDEAASIPSDWKIYENDTYGYSLSYPTDWKITVDADIDPSTVADNDLNKLIGGVHSISFNDEAVQGPVFALEIMNKSIDNAIATDKSVYGARTGESVTIGGVVGEKLSGAFYGMQYINKDGKTYFFEQQNAASDADKKDFDKAMDSFRFIGI